MKDLIKIVLFVSFAACFISCGDGSSSSTSTGSSTHGPQSSTQLPKLILSITLDKKDYFTSEIIKGSLNYKTLAGISNAYIALYEKNADYQKTSPIWKGSFHQLGLSNFNKNFEFDPSQINAANKKRYAPDGEYSFLVFENNNTNYSCEVSFLKSHGTGYIRLDKNDYAVDEPIHISLLYEDNILRNKTARIALFEENSDPSIISPIWESTFAHLGLGPKHKDFIFDPSMIPASEKSRYSSSGNYKFIIYKDRHFDVAYTATYSMVAPSKSTTLPTQKADKVEISFDFVRTETIAKSSPLDDLAIDTIKQLKADWNTNLCNSVNFGEKQNWALYKTFYGVSGCPGYAAPPFIIATDINNRGVLGATFQRLMLNGTKEFIDEMVKQTRLLSSAKRAKIHQYVLAEGLDPNKIYDSNGVMLADGMIILLTHLGILLTKDQMDTKAKEIIQTLKNTVDSNIFSSTGFNDFSTFRTALSNEPGVATTFKYMDDNKYYVVVRSDSAIRPLLMTNNSYFKNQFQTGSSKGLLSPDMRFQVESGRLHVLWSDYDTVPITIRPKYGSLMTKEQLIGNKGGSGGYGDDLWILKKNKIQDCTTWTVGDSLDNITTEYPIAIPEKISDNWFYAFLPLDYVDLSVPFLILPKPPRRDPLDIIFKDPNPMTGKTKPWLSGMHDVPNIGLVKYLEVQIWCKINMNDIESLVYSQKPASPAEKQFLKSKKIKLYDGLPGHMKRLTEVPL